MGEAMIPVHELAASGRIDILWTPVQRRTRQLEPLHDQRVVLFAACKTIEFVEVQVADSVCFDEGKEVPMTGAGYRGSHSTGFDELLHYNALCA